MKGSNDVDMKLEMKEKRQAEADAEKLGDDQGGWDPRAAFISDMVRTIALRSRGTHVWIPGHEHTHSFSEVAQ